MLGGVLEVGLQQMKELSPQEPEPFPWGIVVALCCLAVAIAIIAIGRGWL
jgi:hypothetical protein